MDIILRKTTDFEVSGHGSSREWSLAEPQRLTRVGEGKAEYDSWAKALYSEKGIYFLFSCEDRRLARAGINDYDDLYTGDVVEVFLWPDETRSVYFEYEISPLGAELPLLVSNRDGTFFGWRPWHYEGERRIRKATSISGGPKSPEAEVEEWTAEFFIPFELLRGALKSAPKAGDAWRANMYRIDYDDGRPSHWAWNPETGAVFHNFRCFGKFVFGE